jgi:hypothetical protein
VWCARISRPSFRENKPKTLESPKRSKAQNARF